MLNALAHERQVTIPGATTSITNDVFGQPVTTANPDATVNLSWTLGGQLASETTHYAASAIPDQTVTYTTNGVGDYLRFDANQRLVARDALNASGDTLNLADYTCNAARLCDSTELTRIVGRGLL